MIIPIGDNVSEVFEELFCDVMEAIKNGLRVRPAKPSFSQTDLDVINRILDASSHYSRLGLTHAATKEEVNKAYKRLAAVVHPDKNRAPGSEEAFKALVAARTALINR